VPDRYEKPGVTANGARDTNYLLTQVQLATYVGDSAAAASTESIPHRGACADLVAGVQ
jgi:hypothetical protein